MVIFMNKRGKLSIVVLGITAIIVIVGIVLLLNDPTATGNYVVESGIAQFTPQEACEIMNCLLKEVSGDIRAGSHDAAVAVCACPGGDVRTPLVRRLSLDEYYSYSKR